MNTRMMKDVLLTATLIAAGTAACGPEVKALDANTFDVQGSNASLEIECNEKILTLFLNGGSSVIAGIYDPDLAFDNPSRSRYVEPGQSIAIENDAFSIDLTNKEDTTPYNIHTELTLNNCAIKK